ncbi:methyl-accepting chemotaxis protein [Sphingomonas aerolata]|jgi:methyl-accepting chemotaxis protein|uniref:methyl-accepting chemotaxis protein n=1 Tax=Sphingomonas aerolata TaxID=185951 RepID=UPI002FE425A7
MVLTDERLRTQIGAIAVRLSDIAGCVASEAEAATVVVRGMTEQAHRIADLAAALAEAANAIEEGARSQADTLAHARATLAINKPVIDALTRSAAGVASISVAVSEIARESRTLSLNARIEAARAGNAGKAFAVVAAEMSALTSRTKDATDDISARAEGIARDVGAADEVVAAHEALAAEQHELLSSSLAQAQRQRATAAELATITADTVDTVDQTAAAIGRVGANAVAARMLARQLAKLAKDPVRPA